MISGLIWIESFQNMRIALEERLIHLSASHNIVDKFTTGFGWYQNTAALEKHEVVNLQTKKDIYDVMDDLSSFCRRHQISNKELETVNSEWDRIMNGLKNQLQNIPF